MEDAATMFINVSDVGGIYLVTRITPYNWSAAGSLEDSPRFVDKTGQEWITWITVYRTEEDVLDAVAVEEKWWHNSHVFWSK